MAKKTAERYKCEQCGLVVFVESPCGCEPCDLICCSAPMKPLEEKKASPNALAKPKAKKKAAAKPKPKAKK